MTTNGWLTIPDKPLPLDQCAILVRKVAQTHKRWPMLVGELASKIEDWHGEAASQLVEDFGYPERTLANYRFVYRRCHQNYTPALSFSYWQALAAIDDPKAQADMVVRCMAENWNRGDLRDAIAESLGKVPEAAATRETGVSVSPSALLGAFAEKLVPVAEATREALNSCTPACKVALARHWDELAAAAAAMFEAWER